MREAELEKALTKKLNSRVFRKTGPFVSMIYRMLAQDLVRFIIIYGIFILAFSQVKSTELVESVQGEDLATVLSVQKKIDVIKGSN